MSLLTLKKKVMKIMKRQRKFPKVKNYKVRLQANISWTILPICLLLPFSKNCTGSIFVVLTTACLYLLFYYVKVTFILMARRLLLYQLQGDNSVLKRLLKENDVKWQKDLKSKDSDITFLKKKPKIKMTCSNLSVKCLILRKLNWLILRHTFPIWKWLEDGRNYWIF